MSRAIDFRKQPQFIIEEVPKSGKYLGKRIYWKLYSVENFYRIIIHSILSVQINLNWWVVATPPPIQIQAQRLKDDYLRTPRHSMPGNHLIYFIYLKDLNEIARSNSGLFIPLIPDIDNLVFKIEDIRLPRNVVAHMNFPNSTDRQQIDDLYIYFKTVIEDIQSNKDIITLKVPK